jgi:hypothetical protein
VFPYAYLPSPLALFGQAGSGRRASPTFGVSDRALLKFDDARDPRPEPRAVGSEHYWVPTGRKYEALSVWRDRQNVLADIRR